ncbi:MAG TPA: ribosome-associated ATPase/putative transporter RbbA [Stellaceae bacterium]|nr:ribosome-associated ATPase/putative transporter RbbA [Stellaceae bacterium]
MTCTATSAAVDIGSVRHLYRRTVALDGVSLRVPQSSTMALIGPDGVGKSTLLALVAGVKRIQTGSISALGVDLADRRDRERVQPRIAYMPQGLGKNLYPAMTVGENIEFFGRLFGQDRAERDSRIEKLTGAIGLAQFVKRPMGKLSGGMKQKLGLCCALVHDPDLLILDEPTTGVDPLSRRQFWELVDGIKRARPGLTVMVATSDMDEAERFGRVVMMDGGKILADGAPAALKAKTGTDSLERAFIALLPPERRTSAAAPSETAQIAADAPVVIEAHDLTRRFGDFVAVDRVSFTIRQGEIFGFLGSNGCGKSTTMKMLTGLLPASSGHAELFGRPVDASSATSRRQIGYMSQAFSLYSELTVQQNLQLHADLFGITGDAAQTRLGLVIEQFGLGSYLDSTPDALPLGVRQRLQLAVAIIHEPPLLILDEPTSGVDPVAREMFWKELITLSRQQAVTIFVTTHFMSEATRCDRISFMNAGRVIACGSPTELQSAQNAESLEDAFISYMELGGAKENLPSAESAFAGGASGETEAPSRNFSARRAFAYGWREGIELARDPIRLTIALLGSLILMLVLGFGITLDIDRVKFAVLDWNGSAESRAYIDGFAGSTYFRQQPPLQNETQLLDELRSANIAFAIEIPPDFSSQLRRGRSADVAATVDAANVFRAESIINYVKGVNAQFLDALAKASGNDKPPAKIETRFRYNQAFRSVEALAPSTIALMLVFIPAILTALSVVREKELGTITNFYGTPVSRLEFLLGKQLPYVLLALTNFVAMAIMSVTIFAVPLRGSLAGLTLGAVVYVFATTAIGLLSSCLTKTQMAAVFGTAIATMVPATQFSGMLQPVATLEGSGYVAGLLFPTTYFMKTVVGAFTKSLTFSELLPFIGSTFLFWPILLAIAAALLPKQEA